MSAILVMAAFLAALTGMCALPVAIQYLFRNLIRSWRNTPAGPPAFNPLQEFVQPQIRHVIEVQQQRQKEDREGTS